MTHIIEPFSWKNDSKNCFFSFVSKNRTLNWIRLKELNLFYMTQRFELSCLHDSKKKWTLFSVWRKELNFLFFFFFEHDSQNWTFFLVNVTPRIEFDSRIELFFNTLLNVTQRNWTLFTEMTQRIGLWTFFEMFWLQEVKLLLTREMEFFSIGIKELSVFQLLQNHGPFFELDSLNWPLLTHDSQNYTWKTHRDWTLLFNKENDSIFEYDWKNIPISQNIWLKE